MRPFTENIAITGGATAAHCKYKNTSVYTILYILYIYTCYSCLILGSFQFYS